MIQIISLVLAVLGFILLFAPEYIIEKNKTGSFMDNVYEYHKMIGTSVIALAGYLYWAYSGKVENGGESESYDEELPSYEQATTEGN